MSSTTRRWAAGLCAAVATAPGFADPYWVAWEGDDYPENQGWERIHGDENGHGQGGAERSIQDGVMTIDSTRHHLIYDSSRYDREMNPDPGELFVAEWRLRVNEQYGPLSDVCLVIARDGEGILALKFWPGRFESDFEDWEAPYEPGAFHSFRLESADMVNYAVYVDGSFAAAGVWNPETFRNSYFAFGDSGYGGTVRSLADWDYVRFGVVPEPSGSLMALAVVFCKLRRAVCGARSQLC